MYSWTDRHESYIFFCNIVLTLNLILGLFTLEITPVEIGQTVSQVKPKRWKCISLNEALSSYMLLFNKIISFSITGYDCFVAGYITYRSLNRLLKKRPNFFFTFCFYRSLYVNQENHRCIRSLKKVHTHTEQ